MAKIGRPNIFETVIKPAIDDGTLLELAKNPSMTKRKLAKKLGVSYSAFMQAQKDFSELSDLLKKARKSRIEELEEAAKKEALGYWITEEKTVYRQDEHGKKQAYKEKYKKYVRPSATMQIFLLCNWTHAKDYDAPIKYERDPISTKLREKELEFRKEQADKGDW